MPKNIPHCPEHPPVIRSHLEERTYTIQIITPLFGGGVEPGVIDNHWPIRESAIRGHLRHWWRMTVGYKLGDSMWQREEEIFGSTEFPSPLIIKVLDQPSLQLVDPSSAYGDKFGPVAYAFFSAIENKQQVAKEGFAFQVKLSWEREEALRIRRQAQNKQRKKDKKPLLPETIKDISIDIESAFNAWVAFGGLGARTRRGCGAVYCGDFPTKIPQLPGLVFIGVPKQNALEAWKEAVDVYRHFRQSPRGSIHAKTINTRNGPKTIRVPGRSHWPEADSIRKITGCALKPKSNAQSSGVPTDENTNDHSTPVVPQEVLPAFPKAVLGLPINFHFADGPGKNQPGQPDKDPQDVQLVPLMPNGSGQLEEAERMASPVITRPLWFEGKWHPAVIILDQHFPNGFQVRLKGKEANKNGEDVTCDLPMQHIVGPKIRIARPMRGRASAIEALVKYLAEEKHFQEVRR